MSEKRIDYIDIYKGIGIFLMLLGHAEISKHIDYFIGAFNMPMFFLISGFLFKEKEYNFWDYFKKKLKSLIVPYFSFGIFYYILYLMHSFTISSKLNFNVIFQLFADNTNFPIGGAIWFLTALFFTEIIYIYIYKKKRNKYVLNTIIILITIFGMISKNILPYRLPLALDASFVGLGFYHIGFLLRKNMGKKYINKLLNIKYSKFMILLIFAIFLIFLNDSVNMRTCDYGNFVLFWIVSVLFSILMINLSKYIDKFKNMISIKVKKVLKYIGKNSLVYMLLNQAVFIVFKQITNKIIFTNILSFLGIKLLILVITIIIIYVINKIINKTWLKVFIGK